MNKFQKLISVIATAAMLWSGMVAQPALALDNSVTTNAATAIGNGTATMNGTIGNYASSANSKAGFCWSTSATFSAGQTFTTLPGSTTCEDDTTFSNTTGNSDDISLTKTGLTNGTTYNFAAYIKIKSSGTWTYTLGAQRTFTPALPNAVVTNDVTSVTDTTATFNAQIDNYASASYTAGFCYGTNATPANGSTTNGACVSATFSNTANNTVNISKAMTGLTQLRTYNVRAYVKDGSNNYTYGDVKSFTTDVTTYTITFDKNDGSSTTATQTYNDGTTTALSYNSGWTRTHYTLLGWNTNQNATTALSSYTVSSAATLYAIWQINTFTITYAKNDGSGTTATQTYNSGTTTALTYASGWSRYGYTFQGWATTSGATTALSSYTVTANQTLYAVWSQNTFSVTYDKNDASGTTTVRTIAEGATDALSYSSGWTRTNYAFLGWNTNPSANRALTSYTVTGAVTLYAIWEINAYTITYAKNDGSGTTATQTYNVTTTTALDYSSGWTRYGYTFVGWGRTANATNALSSYTVTADDTLYAIWSQNTFSVTYDKNDGSGTTTVRTLAEGATDALGYSPNWTRSGYTFLGWATTSGATSALGSYTVTGTATLYAVWSQNFFTVTYHKNDGSGSTTTESLAENASGLISNPFSRPGYTFLGWATTSGATSALANYTVTGTAALYAVWVQNTYLIDYHSNDGINNTITKVNTNHGNSDAHRHVDSNATKAGGWTFIGWNTDPNATTALTSYTVECYAQATSTGNPNNPHEYKCADLYAIYVHDKWVIRYHQNDGSNTNTKQIYTTGDTNILDFDPGWTRDGYTVIGWALTQDATVPLESYTLNCENTNQTSTGSAPGKDEDSGYDVCDDLFAVWGVITYDVTYHKNDGGDTTAVEEFTYFQGTDARTYDSGWTYQGYTFVGWALTADGTPITEYDFTCPQGMYKPSDNHDGDGDGVRDNLCLDLYAIWEIVTNTATFKKLSDDSTAYDTQEFLCTEGEVIDSWPTDPTRQGYTFLGWLIGEDETLYNAPGEPYTNTEYTVGDCGDIEFVAAWEIVVNTASFKEDGDDEEPYDTQEFYCTPGALIDSWPNDPTLEGYDFVGWQLNGAGTHYNVPGDPLYTNTEYSVEDCGDLTFVADFEIITNTATFKKLSDDEEDYTTQEFFCDAGAVIDSWPTDPTRQGYTFLGWLIGEDETLYNAPGEPYTNTEYTVGDCGDIEFVAAWEIVVNTASFKEDGDDEEPYDTQEFYCTPGALIDSWPNDPTLEGYDFVGWQLNGAGTHYNVPGDPLYTNTEYSVEDCGDLTFVADFEIITNTASFNKESDDEEPYDTQEFFCDAGAVIDSWPTDPTKTGYTFLGWLIGEDETLYNAPGEPYTNTEYTVGDCGDITFVASWSINSYDVTFDPNNEDPTDTDTYEYNTEITIPGDPGNAPEGKHFCGWSDGTTTYEEGDSYTVGDFDVTFTAQWCLNEYTVTFDPNNEDSNDTQTNEHFEEITLPEGPANNPEGYHFCGWDDGETTYEAGDSYEITGEVTFTAQWCINVYDVVFDPDNGDESDSQTNEHFEDITLPAGPTNLPSNKHFCGWSDGTTTYDAGDSYEVTGDVTFTAQWCEDPKIVFDPNHDDEPTYNSDQFVCTPGAEFSDWGTNPTRLGYRFDGWVIGGATYHVPDFTTDPVSYTNDTYSVLDCYDVGASAVWVDVLTLGIDPNNGSLNGDGTAQFYEVDYGFIAVFVTAPVRDGFTFGGWRVNGTTTIDLPSQLTITEDTYLVAIWIPQTVVVTYHSNDGQDRTATETVNYGSLVGTGSTSWTRVGYTFAGWATSPGGGIISGGVVARDALDLYAVWVQGEVPTVIGPWNDDSTPLSNGTWTVPAPPSSNSPAPFTITVSCGPNGSANGNVITLLQVGTCTITASQAAITVDGVTYTAGQVSMTLTIYTLDPVAPVPPTTDPTVTLTVDQTNGKVTLKQTNGDNADWQLDLSGLDENGNSAPLDTEGRIILESGQKANTNGFGFKPNSDVYVYIFSTPRLLGVLKTDANGNFTGLLDIPLDLADGVHNIQVRGLTPDNVVRTASVPVVLDNKQTVTRIFEKKLFFKGDSPVLSSTVKAALRNLAKRLKETNATSISIDAKGWVWGQGRTAFEKLLSAKRAKNVAAYLKSLGITAKFTSKGVGVASQKNSTARRVDLLVLYTVLVPKK